MQPTGCYTVVASATAELEVCLGNIRLLAGMMLDEQQSLDGDQQTDYLRAIERKARHLLDVTANLGDFAQLGLRRTPLARGEMRVSEIVEQAIEALTPLAGTHRRLIVVAVGTDEPLVSGDYRKLLQAVSGLLRYSLEIAVPAAQILISLRRGEGSLQMEVDVPVQPAPALPHIPGQRLCEAPVHDPSELSAALAEQVFELHGGSLRTLRSERHQRYIVKLPSLRR